MITVIAGKPSEFVFQLSKYSSLPAGTFSFRVKNEGTVRHDFELCDTPGSNLSQDLCAGYESRDLLPGQATMITITHIGKGKYEFLSADPGDAKAGMKGFIGVGVAVAQPRTQAPKPTIPTPVVSPPNPSPVISGTATTPTTTVEPTPTETDTTSASVILSQLG